MRGRTSSAGPRGLPGGRPDVLKGHPNVADIRRQRPRTKIKGRAGHDQHPCRRIVLLQRGPERRQVALPPRLIEGLHAIAPIKTLHHRMAEGVTEPTEEPSGWTPARTKGWHAGCGADVMMMDECCRRDASRLCRCQRAQEVKVGHDDIRRMAREFRADMVGPDRSGQKAPGEEDIGPESLRGPSTEEATGGGDTGERVLGLV